VTDELFGLVMVFGLLLVAIFFQLGKDET